jgi:hypothetical protein
MTQRCRSAATGLPAAIGIHRRSRRNDKACSAPSGTSPCITRTRISRSPRWPVTWASGDTLHRWIEGLPPPGCGGCCSCSCGALATPRLFDPRGARTCGRPHCPTAPPAVCSHLGGAASSLLGRRPHSGRFVVPGLPHARAMGERTARSRPGPVQAGFTRFSRVTQYGIIGRRNRIQWINAGRVKFIADALCRFGVNRRNMSSVKSLSDEGP